MIADLVIQFLALVNFITNLFEKFMKIITKGWSSMVDSQTPDVWVFTHRNAMPWVQKTGSGLSFYPETKKFFKESATKASMDDLVTAEIVDGNGLLVSDATEFFHSIRWGEMVPSVYEIVLVFFLLRDIILSQDTLSSYVLRVMTIDAESVDVPLNHKMAKQPFTSWNAWLPSTFSVNLDSLPLVSSPVAEEVVGQVSGEVAEEATGI
jgi:hypothetical protein